MAFLVSNFKGTELGVFLFGGPTQAAISEADDANDDENYADDAGRFHRADLIMAAGLRSIE